MGLRGKIISLFFVGFSLMTAVAIALLETNLHQGFNSIECEEALRQMTQISHNITNELDRLSQINSDWANWDEMYDYLRHPTREFTDRQINAQAMKTVGLKFATILNKQNEIIFSDSANMTSGDSEDPINFIETINRIKQRIEQSDNRSSTNCGLDTSPIGPILVCWQTIHRTDHSGQFNGTLIVGQMLEGVVMNRIHAQSGIAFEIEPITLSDEPARLLYTALDPNTVKFDPNQAALLTAQLRNIVGQAIYSVRLHYSTSVSQRGDAIIWKVIWALLLVTALNGLMLLFGVHYLVIRRLRQLDKELIQIWRNGRWSDSLPLQKNRDELHHLARSINRMLALIRKQFIGLESLAHTDALTQIANRRAFDQRLALEVQQHQRTQSPLTLILIDVDYFKRYNDYYGHPAGDEVLVTIAAILTQVANRPADLAARIGGEEFAIILPNTNLEGAQHVAENIGARLAEYQLRHADSPVADVITLSIGVTQAINRDDPSALIQRADKATYKAKESGRNKVCVLYEI